MLDAQQTANAAGDKITQIIKCLRLLIKSRHRRQHNSASLSYRRHIAQVNQIERRFAHHENQPPPLLEHDIGRALNQIFRMSVRNARQRLNRTGHDYRWQSR